MKKLALLCATAALSLVIACGSSEVKTAEPQPTPLSGKGTIVALKPAGFALEAEGGKRYNITNADKLDKKVLKDKAKVEFSGSVAPAGDAIEITTVK